MCVCLFLSKYAQPPDKLGDVTSLALTTRFCKPSELKEYRRLGSNQRPQDYESCALPLRHSGNMVLATFLSKYAQTPQINWGW